MNSLIILVSICAFFVAGVLSSEQSFICEKIKDNEENTAILINCIGDNYPEALLNLVSKCYREEFDVSDGTWIDFLRGICDYTEVNAEQLEKYRHCLREGEKEALSNAGVTEEEARRDVEAGEMCVSEKLKRRRRRDVSNLGLI